MNVYSARTCQKTFCLLPFTEKVYNRLCKHNAVRTKKVFVPFSNFTLGCANWNEWKKDNWCHIYLHLTEKEWYFVTKIVLTYCEKKCSGDREKLLKFEAESREFSKFLKSLEQFIQTVKGQNNFWLQNAFLTCSWKFLRSQKIEQL